MNFLRLGHTTQIKEGVIEIVCRFLDCIAGTINVVARSISIVEAHGVIGGAGRGIGSTLTLHEISVGADSLEEAMGLSYFHDLSFGLNCVTDARTLLLAQKM